MTSFPPKPSHVLESILYVKDIKKSVEFYRDVLGIDPDPNLVTERMAAFPLDNMQLLLFQLGQTMEDLHPPGRPHHTIPHHGPTAPVLQELMQNQEKLKHHFCFALQTREDVDKWEEYLKEKGVPILGVMDWDRGGRSVYFADPDGHIGEFGSKGIWPHW